MRKLLFVTALLGLLTACPQVERKIYTFDLKAHTGSLVFQNIVTDDPSAANDDFMQLVTKVVKGTKIEEEHPGWSVVTKNLYETDGRLDGKVAFTFTNPSGAGIYQHDKKSPLIWCASRDEQETIVSTNGTRIPELPGCIAWERKTTQLVVTVRTADLTGGEQSLVGPWRKWSKGEKLTLTHQGFPDLSGPSDGKDVGSAVATKLTQGIVQSIAGDAQLTVGPPTVTGASANAANESLGELQQASLKLCLASVAALKQSVKETLVIAVKPDGTWTLTVKDSSAPDPERQSCYQEALKDAPFPHLDAPWTLTVPLSAAPAAGDAK